MKKFGILLYIVLFLLHCGPKQDKVERIVEDGVEVIINHLEPYEIKGEPNSLRIEEEFNIDMEKDFFTEIGLTGSLAGVDVDSMGNIFIFQLPRKDTDIVFKFDKEGNFLKSFGQRGQGPGEVNFSWYIRLDYQDKVVISGPADRKMFIYSNSGQFESYIAFDFEAMEILPLPNGNYLIKKEVITPESKYIEWPIYIYKSDLKEIKEVDKYFRLDEFKVDTTKFPVPVLIRSVSNGLIYSGYGKRGYEIWVYDFNGNLLRKIKKEYQPVKISEKVKEETREWTKDPRSVTYGKKIRISNHWPPFQYLFTDDEGRLFVMTYEESDKPNQYIYDVFNPDGVFITRISLGNMVFFSLWDIQYATARKGRIYCLQKKPNGYKELVVYKMIWE